jgi:hypothetical protein
MIKFLAALAFVAAPSLAAAQNVPGVAPVTPQAANETSQPSNASERRLTPDQVDAILAKTGKRPADAAVGEGPATGITEARPCPTKPHGEMGVEMGSGGYSGTYGAAVVPLGCNAAVAISVGTSSSNGRYRRR